VPQGEVLRTRGRADRIGLHEPEPLKRWLERHRLTQAARDGKAPQVREAEQMRSEAEPR
jgi:hypothetical protein